jgi:hypothetical protein
MAEGGESTFMRKFIFVEDSQILKEHSCVLQAKTQCADAGLPYFFVPERSILGVPLSYYVPTALNFSFYIFYQY